MLMRLSFAHCEVHFVFAAVYTLTQRIDYTEIDARIIGDTSLHCAKTMSEKKSETQNLINVKAIHFDWIHTNYAHILL